MNNVIRELIICPGILLLSLFNSISMCAANEFLFNDQAYIEMDCFDANRLFDHAKAIIDDKIYIQPNSIYFSSNQIYMKVEDHLIPIQHVSCDGNGVFISIKDIRTGRARWETWICPKCSYENYDGIDYCGTCGRYRYARDRYNADKG